MTGSVRRKNRKTDADWNQPIGTVSGTEIMENATEQAKAAAGKSAADFVEDGMLVGLGTGSTTAFAIIELGRRIREEGLRITGTPTSFAAERLAREHGVPLATLDELDHLDIALDGADEVTDNLALTKGRGAAHTREKIVAALAARFVVLIDPSKLVERLGTRMPVPVEVLPMAVAPVCRSLESLGGTPRLRMGEMKDGPVISDQGFWILDVGFNGIDNPEQLGAEIKALPGVLDHGLFVGMATDILIGEAGKEVRHMTR